MSIPNEEQLMVIAQQIVQQFGPEAASVLAQMILQLVQSSAQQQVQPTYQKSGGKLHRIR